MSRARSFSGVFRAFWRCARLLTAMSECARVSRAWRCCATLLLRDKAGVGGGPGCVMRHRPISATDMRIGQAAAPTPGHHRRRARRRQSGAARPAARRTVRQQMRRQAKPMRPIGRGRPSMGPFRGLWRDGRRWRRRNHLRSGPGLWAFWRSRAPTPSIDRISPSGPRANRGSTA